MNSTQVCHKGYVAYVDNDMRVPRWVAYELTGPHALGCLKRTNNFHTDKALPAGSAAPSDYTKTGYDKGHQGPAEDFAWDKTELSDSFSMANMAPQKPGLNRQQWERLEAAVRSWAVQDKSVTVYVGPVIDKGEKTIGKHKVTVPSGFWKVIINQHDEALAFYMDNKATAKGDLTPFQVTVQEVEAMAGIRFPIKMDESKPALWPVDLSGWTKAHNVACHRGK